MASPFLEFDLTAEVGRLHGETTWSTGQNARTLIKYGDFRVVLMVLQAHAHIPEHQTQGRISVHVLSGHIRLNASGRTFDLRPGSLLALDQR
jgi:quercetin dioxygenase-like cupin family protein